jgi:hypothetical protein
MTWEYDKREYAADNSYDWIKGEMVRTKVMDDGPVLHFVASLGAVRVFAIVFLLPLLLLFHHSECIADE